MIDNFAIASIPFIAAGAVFTFIQFNRGTYRFTITKRILLILATCAAFSLPMSCAIWNNPVCENMPFQMELFFLGYVGLSSLLICAPTLGGWLVGQAIAAMAHGVKTRLDH